MSLNRASAKRWINSVNSLPAKGKDIYYKTPHSIRWIFWPARLIYKLHNIFLLELWVLNGKEISSNHELSVIYAGNIVDRNYFTKLIFDDSFEQKYLGRKWLWQVFEALKKNKQNCSLAIVEVHHNLLSTSRKLDCFYVPGWISGSFDILNDKSAIFHNKNTSLRSDIMKIKKNKLDFKITHEMSHLENFYYNMYEPYISKVYGDRTMFFLTYDFVKREFRKQGAFKDLLLIEKDNDYIAGALLYHKDKYAKLSTLGIKNGDLNYVKDGAVGAIYYFSTLYFERNGFERISLGGSRPFLNDGVLKYKKKWKPSISHHIKSGFIVKMLSETTGCKGFFLNNPFIFEDASGFNGAIFVDNKHELFPQDFEKIYREYYHPGISKLIVYQFGNEKHNDDYRVPPSLSEKIRVKPVQAVRQNELA